MNRVLDNIERQLVGGIVTDAARRRRRRRFAVAGGTATIALLGTGVGIAANNGSPVERMINSPGPAKTSFAMRPGGDRQDVRITDPGGMTWTSATYIAKNGTLTTTQAPDGLPGNPGGGGASGFVIADNLTEAGPAGDDGNLETVVRDGKQHYFFAGTITFGDTVPSIDHVDIEIAGKTTRATLSRAAIRLPVRIDRRYLTPAGKERIKRFPRTVTNRPYAATFAPDAFKQTVGPATIRLTLADGKTIVYRSPRAACVQADCSIDAPTVP